MHSAKPQIPRIANEKMGRCVLLGIYETLSNEFNLE
jgi:hypothetical protein